MTNINRQINMDANGTYNETHYHQAPNPISKFLTQPPSKPDFFIGREKDIETIHNSLFDGNNLLLLVNGEGGIGKTTLAASYWHQYQDKYNHLGWIFAEGRLLNALFTLVSELNIQFTDTMSQDERFKLILKKMAELSKPCLLIIDNANEIAELETYYHALRSCSNFHILLTTRVTEFEQAHSHKIKPLPKDVAIELFKKYYPKHKEAETPLIESIMEAIGYNTLVIELIAKTLYQINRHKSSYTLADMLTQIQNKGLLTVDAQSINTNYHAEWGKLRKETPARIISAMYDLGKLTSEENMLLSIFSVLPAEHITYNNLKRLLAATRESTIKIYSMTKTRGIMISIPSIKNIDTNLTTLSQKGWLEYNATEKTYRVNPVIQEITREKNKSKLFFNCQILINNLNELLDYEAETGHLINISYTEATIFTRYAISVIMNIPQDDVGIAILCEQTGRYFQTTGNLDKAFNLYEHQNNIFKQLHKINTNDYLLKNGLAISFSKLGDIYRTKGDLDKALEFYKHYSFLEEEVCQIAPNHLIDNSKGELAASYLVIGLTYRLKDNREKAFEFYEKSLHIDEYLHKTYPEKNLFINNLAISYERLGDLHYLNGDEEKAFEFYIKEYNLLRKLCDKSPHNVSAKNNLAISCGRLGDSYSSKGDKTKGLQFLEEALKITTELYTTYPDNIMFKNYLAIVYSKLGDIYNDLKRIEISLEFYSKSIQFAKELCDNYSDNTLFKNNLAHSYSMLGNLHDDYNQNDKALECFNQNMVLRKQLSDNDPNNHSLKDNLAISYGKLGNIYKKKKNKIKAIDYFYLAEQIYKELFETVPQNTEYKDYLQEIKKELVDLKTPWFLRILPIFKPFQKN